MIYIRVKSIFLLVIFLNIFSINVYSDEINNTNIDKIKIGIYDDKPYTSIDHNGKISGYYPEVIKLLNKKYDFEYEYIICNFSDGLKMLESNSIDVMFGVAMTPERTDKIIFNKYRICLETHAIVTNLDIIPGDLERLNGLRFGLIEDGANSQWILDFLNSKGIYVIPVYDESFDNLEEKLINNEIDIMLSDNINTTPYTIIYKFIGHQVYIAGNKNNYHILESFDEAIEGLGNRTSSEINTLYEKYFIPNKNSKFIRNIVLLIITNIIFLTLIFLFMIPRFKMKKIRKKIKMRLLNNSYFLNYQPIYNPRNNNIVGFEALLRLKDNNKLIFPSEFIPEIEMSNMLYDISLWILKQVIEEYKKIESFKCVEGHNFYISMNLSLNEIENKDFVTSAIEILSNSNLGPNKICLEIVEKVKINDLDKITTYISALKNAGFKIAIDDFGVEYSNLDIIRKLDFDIIKIDKYFIDSICEDEIQKEIVLFISRIAYSTNKYIVLEGIEEMNQHDLIKHIDNGNLYVQGYLYNKPMLIDEIGKI